jgi:hypothetical protein
MLLGDRHATGLLSAIGRGQQRAFCLQQLRGGVARFLDTGLRGSAPEIDDLAERGELVDELLDLLDRCAGREGLSSGLNELGAAGRCCRARSTAPHRLRRDAPCAAPSRAGWPARPGRGRARRRGRATPLATAPAPRVWRLVRPRVQRGHLRGLGRQQAALLEALHDLPAAAREVVDDARSTPATSAVPDSTNVHCTPSRSVSSSRRAAWYR